ANDEGRRFNEYQKALFRGDEPDRAWAAIFPEYSTAEGLAVLQQKLQEAMRELNFSRKYKSASATLVPYQGSVTVRVVPEPETLRLANLERAAGLAPADAWLLQRLALADVRAGHAALAPPLLRRSLALHPDDAEALATFARAAQALGDCAAAGSLAEMALARF